MPLEKLPSITIVKDPIRLYEAIQAFREEAESIELQSLYGDEINAATKADVAALRQDIALLHENLDDIRRIVGIIFDDLTADKQEEPSQLYPEAVVDAFKMWDVYNNADLEDGVAECACSSCGCGGWTDFVPEDQTPPANDKQMPGAYSARLAGDECGCEGCRHV